MSLDYYYLGELFVNNWEFPVMKIVEHIFVVFTKNGYISFFKPTNPKIEYVEFFVCAKYSELAVNIKTKKWINLCILFFIFGF